MAIQEVRQNVFTPFGATSSVAEELLVYNKNLFNHSFLTEPLELPLKEEPFVAAWRNYIQEAGEKGFFECLKERLIQIQFPIQAGLSETDFYKSATRRGTSVEKMDQATGLILKRPETLYFILHPTPAGPIPIIITGAREDFIALVQALTMRNEPEPVPDSMGATIVAGYNNWDRIKTLRLRWEKENQGLAAMMGWPDEFKRIIADKELYQDRFIILSDGPYSGVPAREMGLSEEDWKAASLTIRREHEGTHYFTRRIFSSMRNNLIDEFIADYMGIVAAAGYFRADWFLRFIGLESFPAYREGARLQNYRGQPPLSDEAFKALQLIVKNAAESLERFDTEHRAMLTGTGGKVRMLIALTCLTLEELASEEVFSRLEAILSKLQEKVIFSEEGDR